MLVNDIFAIRLYIIYVIRKKKKLNEISYKNVGITSF